MTHNSKPRLPDVLVRRSQLTTHCSQLIAQYSLLKNLPIAALVLTVGEKGALVIWPLLLFGLSLFLIIRAAHLIGGETAVLPAAVTGALALHFVNVFLPGALDHHNAQLALALGTTYALMLGV